MSTPGTVSGETANQPADFRAAVAAMTAAHPRPDITVGAIRPPQRLAPYSYALGVEVAAEASDIVPTDSDGSAFGRLVLLYDPEGHEAWNGTFRLVAFLQAEIDESVAGDPALPEAAWSWLTESLDVDADDSLITALGGTVTATTSVRFGDIAGPPRAHQLELRASWTSTTPELAAQVEAFGETLALAAGLPPVGVTTLQPR